MLSHLIYFFAPFSINYIPHNYFIPQAIPPAIPQTHHAFYPHRTGTTVMVTNKARRTTLNGFNTDNVFLCIWIPGDGAVLAYRVDLDNSATRR